MDIPRSLLLGDNTPISCRVLPVNAENQNVTLTSSDENVAIIEGNTLKTVGLGTTTITATTEDGNHKSTAELRVTDVANYISLSASYSEITVGL